MEFILETRIAAPASVVFGFHEAPDALARLQPPWQAVEILQAPSSLAVGTRVVLRVRIMFWWQRIEALHVAYEPGRSFSDRMERGPFPFWLHHHIVTPLGPDDCLLTDRVEYRLPLGVLGPLLLGGFVRRDLQRLFEYRHRVTREACEAPGLQQ